MGQVTKKCFVEPIWRAGGTQAKISAKFGQNGLCVLAGSSKSAYCRIFFYLFLNYPISDYIKNWNERPGSFFL